MKALIFLFFPALLSAAEWQSPDGTKHYYERFRLAPASLECWIFVMDEPILVPTRDHRVFPGLLDSLAEYGIYERIEWHVNDDGSRAGVKRTSRAIFEPYEEMHRGRRDINQHFFVIQADSCDANPDDGCETYLAEPTLTAAASEAALQWAVGNMDTFNVEKSAHQAELVRQRSQSNTYRQLPAR